MRRASVVAPINGRFVIQEGEQTGHDHSIRANPNVAFLTDGIDSFLTVRRRPAKLVHQEHDTGVIAPHAEGYDVVIQRTADVGEGTQQRVQSVWD
jgi:hypothetical protein